MPDRFVRDLSSGAVAALFFLLWENMITLDDEVEHIWKLPNTSWIKWAFLFARYFSLSVSFSNRVIEWRVIQGYFANNSGVDSIRIWYTSQVLIGHVAMTGAEIVMMARVYALYNRSRYIFWFFVCLVIGETTAVVVGLILSIPNESKFKPQFVLLRPPDSLIYFGSTVLVSQLVILSLSIYKYSREEWRGTPIVSLLMRDGSLTFGALSTISIITLVCTAIKQAYASASYAWFISFISSAECRIILNLQKLPSDSRSSHGDTTLQLTTLNTADLTAGVSQFNAYESQNTARPPEP